MEPSLDADATFEQLSSVSHRAAAWVALGDLATRRGEDREAAHLYRRAAEALQDFQGSAPAAAFAALEDKLAGAQNYEIDQVRRQLPDLLKGSKPDIGAAVEWVMAANSRISAMTNAESSLVNDIARVSETTQLAQERRTLVLVTVAVDGHAEQERQERQQGGKGTALPIPRRVIEAVAAKVDGKVVDVRDTGVLHGTSTRRLRDALEGRRFTEPERPSVAIEVRPSAVGVVLRVSR